MIEITQWIVDNWAPLLGGGSLTAIINYFLFGKTTKEKEFKKADVEIESAEIDYAVKVKDLYETLLERANKEKDDLKTSYDLIVIDFKNEKDYFRGQIDDLRKQASEMQIQFNTIQLAYAKEVEQSQNWEKLHRELTDKYNELSRDHEKLKKEFEQYKKNNK